MLRNTERGSPKRAFRIFLCATVLLSCHPVRAAGERSAISLTVPAFGYSRFEGKERWYAEALPVLVEAPLGGSFGLRLHPKLFVRDSSDSDLELHSYGLKVFVPAYLSAYGEPGGYRGLVFGPVASWVRWTEEEGRDLEDDETTSAGVAAGYGWSWRSGIFLEVKSRLRRQWWANETHNIWDVRLLAGYRLR